VGSDTSSPDEPRIGPSYLPVAQRLTNWKEFTSPQPEDVLRTQGSRCMDCGIPYCQAVGCPVYNLIPEWNDLVSQGEWQDAWDRLEATNNLPEITGRICPAPCEPACTLAVNSYAVTIQQIELAIVERAFASGWVVPRPPQTLSGRTVAVVGSGPAGLSAAQQLRRAGHEVTVFERSPRAGGLLRYGIPDFKLEKHVVDRRLEQIEAEGVRFETGVSVGTDISAHDLRDSFDAVLLALGAGEPRDLRVSGRELDGIHFAMDFLELANRAVAGEIEESDTISAKDRGVLVIGGGDTGSDCVGTSNRMGAKNVLQVEILPKPPQWTASWNPDWPDWPNILRTSSSHAEGCERDWSIDTRGFVGKDGHVTHAQLVRVDWKEPVGGGPAWFEEVPESNFRVEADLVLLAVGFLHVQHSQWLEELGVELDTRGNIATSPTYTTSAPGVFSAGDSSTGASLIVRAIYHGREAARQIDAFLRT
jgi:glutamate synthase (NADPH/NADH) small chain